MSKKPKFKIGKYWLSQVKSSKYYQATWWDYKSGSTKRASLGTTNFQSAQIKLAEWAIANKKIRHNLPEDLLITTVLVRYYEKHGKHTRSEDAARRALAKWNAFYETSTVADITPETQKQFIAFLKRKNYKNEYINRILTIGRAALNYAHQNQEITHVPPIKLLPGGEPRDLILTIDEVCRLLDHASTPHIFLYCLIAFNTLARPEAILELTPFQIDFDNRLINLNPRGRIQTKKYRPVIPLTKTLMPWLRDCKHETFVNYRGSPVRSIKSAWRKMRDAADLPKETVPYTIRHTMATELRKANVPPWEVSGFLGHANSGYKTTERYAKFSPDYLSHAAAEIDRYFVKIQQKTQRRVTGLGLIKKPENDKNPT